MRKKFAAFWATLVLCLLMALPAFAAKPALQAYVESDMNSVGGVSTTIHYRNNTGKTIKYIHWYMSPYNAVNDKVKSEIGNYAYGEETGPVAPFSAKLEKYGDNYAVFNGSLYRVSTDSYGCPYIYTGGQTYYLTDSEVNNYVLDREVYFDCMWYNWSIDHVVLDKAVIIYMDGSRQTVSGSSLTMNNSGILPKNDSFENEESFYEDVYAYSQYRAYNPDLVAAFGDDEHKYLEHFISSGMKEGRRGKYEFDLAAYKANNPDLVAVFGDDNQKYYDHYISSGKNEGRSAISGVPELEVMEFTGGFNSDKTTYYNAFYFRNNTGKQIQQVSFTVTAYDKNGNTRIDLDTVKSTKEFTVTGALEPETVDRNRATTIYTNDAVPEDSPFHTYREALYWVNHDGRQLDVYLDKYDRFFVMASGAKVGGDNSYTYLTQDEIDHALYHYFVRFDKAWNNSYIDHAILNNVTITYADGTVETIPASRAMSTRRKASLQNQPVMS